MSRSEDDWVRSVEDRIATFASTHGTTYSATKRQQSAAFEIGCLLHVVDDYSDQRVSVSVQNLRSDGEFRYLTSPSGKPDNFSWIRVDVGRRKFDLRQQVRIRSHLHPEGVWFSYCAGVRSLKAGKTAKFWPGPMISPASAPRSG